MSLFNKTFTTLLLCLILVGQSMASSVMVYKMAGMDMASMNAMSAASNSMENMAMMEMDHSQMLMTADSTTDSSAVDDCCTKKCQCFASGCSSISAFSKIMSADIIVEPPTKIYSNLLLVPAQALTSLYRPPILS